MSSEKSTKTFPRPPPEVVEEQRILRKAQRKARVINGLRMLETPWFVANKPTWRVYLTQYGVEHRIKAAGLKLPLGHYRLISAYCGKFGWGWFSGSALFRDLVAQRIVDNLVKALVYLPTVMTPGELASLHTQLQLCDTQLAFALTLIEEMALREQG